MTRIRVDHLTFSYGQGEAVLKDITLDFDHRSTAIIGQNGAGKSTFVKLLKGLLKPSSGEIEVNGLNVKHTTAANLAKHIGLVFQNPNDQIFKGRVLDEVMFGPRNIGQDEVTAKENALKALEMVGLEGKQDFNPHDLSLSEKKLVCIASVLAMDPGIIIFDEPTIAQDHAGKEKIKQVIHTLKKQNKLVMTIIHDMDFVAENFERTIVFHQGTVLLDGDTREVFSRKEMLEQARLEAPHITQLGEKLGYNDRTFLTPEEFIEFKRNEKIQ
jgi:energy-coupling factor transport system ATP-binding protein